MKSIILVGITKTYTCENLKRNKQNHTVIQDSHSHTHKHMEPNAHFSLASSSRLHTQVTSIRKWNEYWNIETPLWSLYIVELSSWVG